MGEFRGFLGPSEWVYGHAKHPMGMEATWARLNAESTLWAGVISDYRYTLGTDESTQAFGVGFEAGFAYLGAGIILPRQIESSNPCVGMIVYNQSTVDGVAWQPRALLTLRLDSQHKAVRRWHTDRIECFRGSLMHRSHSRSFHRFIK